VWLVFKALQDAKLYVDKKKTKLFQTEINFLGHKISTRGVEADKKKIDVILNWPQPKSATKVWAFIGLVRYISVFLPKLSDHTSKFADLITKDSDKCFPPWSEDHQLAFEAIKVLVVSRECLTTIDLKLMPDYKIFVTTDASNKSSGAVLSFGKTWKSACPVAFESRTFKGAQLHYPVHKKKMLSIIRALDKWRADLLGVPFLVYTDHKTLENFDKTCPSAKLDGWSLCYNLTRR
jgi:RNase H-like domain found in reverse transcriptase